MRTTLSIDEEGHVSPRRRQRLDNLRPAVDRNPGGSSSDSVERSSPELVNSSSSNESSSSDSFDEDSSENNQIDSDKALLNLRLTGGTNGLQTACMESFDVEEVPYSSTAQKTLRKVQVIMIVL